MITVSGTQLRHRTGLGVYWSTQ